MKKFLSYLPLSAAALVALSFAACTDSDVVADGVANGKTENLENAIQFSTYLASSTRAGYAGPIDTDVLKTKTPGFGVFGYYTGKKTYSEWATGYASESPTDYQTFRTPTIPIANFMFNQKVYWDATLGNSYVTKGWTYTPLKYWPNEVGGTNAPDDDQNNNTKSDPATGSGTYGGNMTFFAYAPYVEFPVSGEDGIIAINGTTALTVANVVKEEPTITYVASTTPANIVDLLWGTKGGTSTGVYGAANVGVSYSNDGSATNWQKTILKHGDPADGYTMLADLTKQKTDGTVDILFKHALGKVGGSSVKQTLSGGGTSYQNGLMVVLDLDDLKGGESGGTKEDATKVTITDITIAARTLIADASNKTPGQEGYQSTYLKINQGRINLATGQWKVMTDISGSDNTTKWNGTNDYTNGDPATTTLEIGRTHTSKLADNLQEPAEVEKTATAFDALPAGVTTSMQNVYGTEASPLVYIPSTYPELTISVDYTVRTKDANLGEAFSEVRQKITKKVTLTSPIELNKMYNILIHLGLTSVKFTANVSDWEVDKSSTSGTEEYLDDDNVVDLVVQDAYLPINVGSYNNAITLNYTNGETPVAMTAGTDKSIVNLGSKDVLNYTFVSAKIKDNKGTGVNDITEGTYTLSTDATSWITIGADKKISASANTTFAARTGSVYIEYNGEKYEFLRIVQAGRTATSVTATYSAGPTLTFAHTAQNGASIGTLETLEATYKESDNTPGASPIDVTSYTDKLYWDQDYATKKGSATVVDLTANTGAADRPANLKINIEGTVLTVQNGNGSGNLSITQSGNTTVTSVTSSVTEIPANATNATPTYTLYNSDGTDITNSVSATSYAVTAGSATINSSTGALTLTANSSTTNNPITVTVNGTASCVITQRASGLTIADPSPFAAAAQGPTSMALAVTTTVDGNSVTATDCGYASNRTWAVVTKDGSNVYITLTANATGSARTATITVTKDDATGTFTITQNP